METDPVVDERDAEKLLEAVTESAPFYTPEWDPTSGDEGAVLFRLFSAIAEDVIERLNRVPGKHRVSFFDELGFSREPPQPSRVPVTFHVSDGAVENVPIPSGTRMVAEATEDGLERTFEIAPGGGFEATASNAVRAYSVDPSADGIFEHPETLETGAEAELFAGRDRQDHALYIGHGDLLCLTPGSTIQVEIETTAPKGVLRDCLVWEYYGVEGNGGGKKGWHPLRNLDDEEPGACPWSDVVLVEELIDEMRPLVARHGYVPTAALSDETKGGLHSSLAEELRERTDLLSTFEARVDRTERDRLPRRLLPSAEPSDDLLEALWEPLGRTLRAMESRRVGSEDHVQLHFELPGETNETEIASRECRWIRCRIPRADSSRNLFDITASSVRLAVGPVDLAPDTLLYNDVPLGAENDEADIYPFGEAPGPLDAFYIASDEAFTKRGTAVEIAFVEPAESIGLESIESTLRLSWEYWNGSSWARIEGLRDGTAELREAGTVSFAVPQDVAPTGVAGHDGYWIRIRLVSGDYKRTRVEQTPGESDAWKTITEGEPPRFGGVRLHYDQSHRPDHLLTKNNLEYGDDVARRNLERFRPFERVSDEEQTIYLGFDGKLSNGPINTLFAVEDREYPDGFYPKVCWEYCEDPKNDEWSRLAVRDGTGGLTEGGIVGLTFPEDTGSFRLFGRELHWIRARVTGDEFVRPVFVRASEGDETESPSRSESYLKALETGSSRRGLVESPPVLRGVHLNSGWAYNMRAIEGEIVGSSEGAPDQNFVVSSPPVRDEAVWVDEHSVLSEERRRELTATRPARVEEVVGPNGETRAFWVRWSRETDFSESGTDAEQRHYTLDRTTGKISFGGRNSGESTSGRIPPRGRDNVRVDYRTGGGIEGNVERGAITGLISSVPFIDAVSNPEPGDGGADEETMEQAVTRAPKQLRDRGRAVSKADFERVAMAASRRLGKAKCIPAMDKTGEYNPGWVTLLIVPHTQARKPVPSVGLKRRVVEALSERAPAAVVDPKGERFVVRGPSYVEASVDATIEATEGESISTLEEDVSRAVETFFHPISGGSNGGWDFGELPYLSDLYGLLEGIDGVDHVEELSMTFKTEANDVTVTEGEDNPDVASDALICSGTHRIVATGGR